MIHPTYLPFTRQQLLPHFQNERHLDNLITSAHRQTEFTSRFHSSLVGMPISDDVRKNRQIERDEQCWTVSCLKAVFDAGALSALLRRAFGNDPPLDGGDTWETCIGTPMDQELLFEVGIPSPQSYRDHLKERYQSNGRSAHFVPYVMDAAAGRTTFEGATRVDAVFRNRRTGFAVMFEAKVLSDCSCSVTFDPVRNQLARNIDVMLDDASSTHLAPDVDRRLLCLLTPRLFQAEPSHRHYGMLYHQYKTSPSLLATHLPHRPATMMESAVSRLGWMTFEDCVEECPSACPWMGQTPKT